MPRDSGLAAIPGAAARDLLEEAHREGVAQPVDARVVGRVAVLRVELAQLPIAIAAELIEPSLVARVVDRRRDPGSTLGSEEDVVVCRMLRRKLHDVSANPCARRSLTR
jgi:hypothetical protein